MLPKVPAEATGAFTVPVATEEEAHAEPINSAAAENTTVSRLNRNSTCASRE